MITEREEQMHFAIHLVETGEFIGFSHIAFIDNYSKTCRIGIVIGEKQYWNRGLGTAAMRMMADFCFTDLGLNRITCEVYETNPRAWHMLESVGFKREGVLRENVLKEERFINEFVYGLLRHDYEKEKV